MAELDTQQLFESAVAHQQAGRLGEAQSLCKQILLRDPQDADALQLLGLVTLQLGDKLAALEMLQRAAAMNPEAPDCHCSLGMVLSTLDRHEEAAAQFRQALSLKSDYVEAGWRLGGALRTLGRWQEAEEIYRQTAQRQPELAGQFFALGNRLREQGRWDEAIAAYHHALALQPQYLEAYNHLAVVLESRGQEDEAIAALRQAVALQPDYAPALHNLGNTLYTKSQMGEAIAALEKVCALQPDDAEARFDLALALLRDGDFARGWKEFEWRLRHPHLNLARDFTQPQWRGQDIAGQTILLHAQGGFGDVLQFVRYAPLVAQRGAKVLLECKAELVSLLQSVKGVQAVISRGQALPPFDWHSPLPSLPLAFGTSLETIPADVPYLSPPPPAQALWKQRVGEGPSFKIGLVWAGRSFQSNHLQIFAPLGKIPGVRFFSLQKGPQSVQQPPAGMDLKDFTADLRDFADTAALIQQMDLVIGVDTAVVHLAGALAKPVWVLIPCRSDFRWLLDRCDSPWYPTMRLFRQIRPGDWDTPTAQMAAALRSKVFPPPGAESGG